MSDWDFRWAFSGGGSLVAEVTVGAPRLEPDGALVMNYTSMAVGGGRWRLRADTLERIGQLPPVAATLPAALFRVQSKYPGMEVQTLVTRSAGRRWVLRWETLGRNRDRPRAEAPPPSELRIYELPDAVQSDAARVGS